jgi:hypothetical protein
MEVFLDEQKSKEKPEELSCFCKKCQSPGIPGKILVWHQHFTSSQLCQSGIGIPT